MLSVRRLAFFCGILAASHCASTASGPGAVSPGSASPAASAPPATEPVVTAPATAAAEGPHEAGAKVEIYLEPESTGDAQSPIDIDETTAAQGHHAFRLHYKAAREHLAHLEHTIRVNVDPGSSLEFDGKTYDLAQFHFHTPAEHLVDGVTYPMELHIVHTLRGSPDHYLVLGVLFKEGTSSPILEKLLPQIPKKVGETVDLADTRLDVADLVSNNEHYFHYEGSLTTPPYTEAVTWIVLKSVHTATGAQIEAMNLLEGNNARHIQGVHARAVDAN
jgi:carbonic anhydrase